jgi:hypothetical protein
VLAVLESDQLKQQLNEANGELDKAANNWILPASGEPRQKSPTVSDIERNRAEADYCRQSVIKNFASPEDSPGSQLNQKSDHRPDYHLGREEDARQATSWRGTSAHDGRGG